MLRNKHIQHFQVVVSLQTSILQEETLSKKDFQLKHFASVTGTVDNNNSPYGLSLLFKEGGEMKKKMLPGCMRDYFSVSNIILIFV